MKILHVLIFLLAYAPVTAQEIKPLLIKEVEPCTSNAPEIIGSQDNSRVQTYMRSMIKKDFISKLGTTVHECLHGYDNDLSLQLEWKEDHVPVAYFIDEDIIIRFIGRELFHTADLHKNYFPKDVKNLFRYNVYIHSDTKPSIVTANVLGIYGLLEEFNAYYHDLKSQIEYFNCHRDKYENETFSNDLHAYFEFNIFIGYYLKYASLYEKEDYKYLINSKELKTVYTLIETNWRNLFTEIMKEKDLANRMPSYDEELRLLNDDIRAQLSKIMLHDKELSTYHEFLDDRPYDLSVISENKDWAEQINASGFGAGMGLDELESTFGDMDNISLDFDFKETGMYYVCILETKSEEALYSTIVKYIAEYPKMAILVDETLTFKVYLKKFNKKTEADDYLKSIDIDEGWVE